jgi:uncharacterized protein (DUF2336 family)
MIAGDPEAPLDLLLFLVNDHIEVARPLILRSKCLADEELLKFIGEADIARQSLCAQRPHIGEPVTNVLAASDAEPVLAALVRNLTARIAASAFERLVEKSKAFVSLQEPLVNRPDLPPVLARKMCDWVSAALKAHIGRNYGFNTEDVTDAIDRASTAVRSAATGDRPDSSHKLVEKLAMAGQLKAGFLLRVLHQGQLDLFEVAFAKLLQIDHTRIRRVLYESGPRNVAMACRAVGIDRSVFPTVYNLSRQQRRIHPLLSADDRVDADAVFSSYSKAEALARLQAGQA